MNETKNGIVYCDPPIETDIIEFLYKHLGCDCAIEYTDLSTYDVKVIAYSSDTMYNKDLDYLYRDRTDVMLVTGIDKEEMNMID